MRNHKIMPYHPTECDTQFLDRSQSGTIPQPTEVISFQRLFRWITHLICQVIRAQSCLTPIEIILAGGDPQFLDICGS